MWTQASNVDSIYYLIKRLKKTGQLVLSELIEKLDSLDQELPIYFDDLKYRPSGIGSWRGAYEEVAISYRLDKDDQVDIKVRDFVALLKSSVESTMLGYKGGEYPITKITPVWVANYGESGGYKTDEDFNPQAVVDVKEIDGKVILVTEVMEYTW